MTPSINNPGGVKNAPEEIRDGVVSDATRFPGGFIDQQITEAGAAIQILGQFQLNNAAFVEQFDVSLQTAVPVGIAIQPDGSQIYLVDTGTPQINQYSLSTAFDVSTASFDLSFDVSPQDSGPSEIVFNTDGGQMYITGRSNTNVYQYSLSTAFDVSTASFDLSFDVSSQDSTPRGLSFSADGSRMYVAGVSNVRIYQYNLSTAFDISTASFDLSLDVSSRNTSPQDVTFRPDGSQMYVAGISTSNVDQYNLSTAFDISTASFDLSFDVSSQDDSPTGIVFKSDGSQLYVAGNQNDIVSQYAVGTIAKEF